MKKIKNFTLIELLVKRSHLCCNHVEGNDDETSPVHGQVKQYCFTCPWTGEAVLLHLNRTSGKYFYLISAFFQTLYLYGSVRMCTETYGECRSQKYTASYLQSKCFMFAAGKRFMQQRCASHGGAVLHSISVHADRAIGRYRDHRHFGGNSASGTSAGT